MNQPVFRSPVFFLAAGKLILVLVALLYLVVLVIPLIEPRPAAMVLLPAAGLLPFLLTGLFLFVGGSGYYTLGEDAIHWVRFKRRKRLAFAEITRVYDSGSLGIPSLVLLTPRDRLVVSRLVEDFPVLYETLRRKIPVISLEEQQVAFPFHLKLRPAYILDTVGGVLVVCAILGLAPLAIILSNPGENRLLVFGLTFFLGGIGVLFAILATLKVAPGLRNYTFTPDEIARRDLLGDETTWDIQDVESIGRITRQHPNRNVSRMIHPLVISLTGGAELTLNEDAGRAYGLSLEGIEGRLRRLYPALADRDRTHASTNGEPKP